MTERELIRKLRKRFVKGHCGCGVIKDYVCERCTVIKLIDEGLAEIGQSISEVMADEGYRGAVLDTLVEDNCRG